MTSLRVCRHFFLASVLFSAQEVVGQNCSEFTTQIKDASGDVTVAAKNAINLTSQSSRNGMDMIALASSNTIAFVVDMSGRLWCPAPGDLMEFTFADSSTLMLANEFSANCDGRLAAYLGPLNRNHGTISLLSTKAVSQLTIFTHTDSLVMSLNADQEKQFRNIITCLASYISVPADYKGDSIRQYKKPRLIRPSNSGDSTRIYTVVETQPQFEGGYVAMMNFISKNLRYPADARKSRASGIVYVSFLVGKDGTVMEPKISKGVHPSLDAEVLRVVKMMPRWKPGMQSGVPVVVQFNLPIKFSL